MTRLRATAALLVGVAAVAVQPAPGSAAGAVGCGDTVTASITLEADLRCPGDGLVVAANGVTIDLGGHVLAGTGSGTAVTVAGDQTLSGVTVTNGTVRGFPAGGIVLQDVRDVSLTDVRLVDTDVYASQFTGLTIRSSVLAGSGVGGTAGSGITVSDVRMTNGFLSAIGVHDVSVVDSVLLASRVGGVEFYSFELAHSRLVDTLVDVTEAGGFAIHHNRMTGQGFLGLLTDGVAIHDNVLQDMPYGVRLYSGRGVQVRDNRFERTDYGVHVSPTVLAEAADLTVTGNHFVRNGSAGVFIESADLGVGVDDRFTVSGNVFRENGHTGQDVDADGRRIDDGLHTNLPVDSPLVVEGNRTYANADHGIEALPEGSVRDGGGNVSRGDRRGCAGVVCGYR